jgi:DNA-binding transcriptional ArsR family regulator
MTVTLHRSARTEPKLAADPTTLRSGPITLACVTSATRSEAPAIEAQELTDLLKVLGNPVRLELLHWLKDPRQHFPPEQLPDDPDRVGVCVTYLQAKAGLAQSTTSTYLASMERVGLVRSTRVGKFVHYRRDEQRIDELRALLARAL